MLDLLGQRDPKVLPVLLEPTVRMARTGTMESAVTLDLPVVLVKEAPRDRTETMDRSSQLPACHKDPPANPELMEAPVEMVRQELLAMQDQTELPVPREMLAVPARMEVLAATENPVLLVLLDPKDLALTAHLLVWLLAIRLEQRW